MSNTYYYIPNVWKDNPDIEDAYSFTSSSWDIFSAKGGYDEIEVRWMVEDMAKDYYDNHDGWEIANSWHGEARDFAVWDSNKNFIGIFEVGLEYTPVFSAWRK